MRQNLLSSPEFRALAMKGAQQELAALHARVYALFPELRPAAEQEEAAHARRFIHRAVTEAERIGKPRDHQRILWQQLTALTNTAQRAYRRQLATENGENGYGKRNGLHWTQTPEGRRKMAKAQRKAWRTRRQGAK
jgi:hypothetical protein